MVFGDFDNDIKMLNQAHYSFVMANAHPDIFKYANYHAKRNDQNGVLDAIKQDNLTKD